MENTEKREEETVRQLIQQAKALKASDLHLKAGLPPSIRVDGSLTGLPGYGPLSREQCDRLCAELLQGDLPNSGELDFARTVEQTRLRVNLFYSQGGICAAIRLLSDVIPALDSLGLPPSAMDLKNLARGIVLVTGQTGSGKSTTLASILNEINHTRPCHILTLEDPIEYQYTPDKSLINQRQIGTDTESYAIGLRAALREDPDILLIGEMRDMDTIETALTAAETGHLVFATLHTNSAADSVDRIVSVFPSGRQQQVRMQLSMTLKTVISQQLLPRIGGGRALACEVMIVNAAIRNLIREGKTPQIASTVATSAREGSLAMDACLMKLYRERRITKDTAIQAAQDPEYMKKSLL